MPGSAGPDVFLRGDAQATRRQARRAAQAARPTRSPGRDSARRPAENTMMNTPDRLAGEPARVPLARCSSTTCSCPARRRSTSRPRSSKPQTNLGALLVDYGAGDADLAHGDGIVHPPRPATAGARPANAQRRGPRLHHRRWRAPHRPRERHRVLLPGGPSRLTNVTSWRLTKGILDSSNRDSLLTPTRSRNDRRDVSLRVPDAAGRDVVSRPATRSASSCCELHLVSSASTAPRRPRSRSTRRL